MPQIKTTLDAEQEAFDKEVAEIKAWWDSSGKQRQLKRYVLSSDANINVFWIADYPKQPLSSRTNCSPSQFSQAEICLK